MSTELWRTRPYAHRLQHIVDGPYEQAFAPFTTSNPSDGGSTGFQSLAVNVWETDEAYLATLMAPGLDEQTINVTIQEDMLAIEGALAFEAPAGARAVVWQEFGPTNSGALCGWAHQSMRPTWRRFITTGYSCSRCLRSSISSRARSKCRCR
jgi:hypothetical protein